MKLFGYEITIKKAINQEELRDLCKRQADEREKWRRDSSFARLKKVQEENAKMKFDL